jgi:undecaprenyl-diphosphatase
MKSRSGKLCTAWSFTSVALRGSWGIWLLGLAVVGGATSIFLWLAGEVLEQETLPLDVPLMLLIHHLSTPWLDRMLRAVSWIGSPGAFLVTPLAGVWLWRQHRLMAAIALVVSTVGAGLLNIWLKWFFARPRPTLFPPVIMDTSYSFPSGHTMGAVALYGFVAYVLWQQRQRVWALLAVFFALLIALSRIYLGVHYPSDILAALAVTLVWLTLVIIGYRYYQHRSPPPRR